MWSSNKRIIIFVSISLLLSIIPITIGLVLQDTRNTSLVWMFISVLVVVISWSAVWAVISYKLFKKPLHAVNDACKKLIKGKYDTRITAQRADSQVIQLIDNFNKIASDFESLEEMRKSFVASASHELRSPLTSMQGFLQALLDGTITEQDEKEKYLRIVYNETKRLGSLINTMLSLSRMEYGSEQLLKSSFDVHETIRQVVDRFATTLQKTQTQIKLDFSVETAHVYADQEKIVQVISNIVDNAIKYSPAFSDIEIKTYIHNKRVYIVIKDYGMGINKKDQSLIWDKFYMVDKARTPRKVLGTGLGLSIVKKIIEDHNETIWVESKQGEGATFIFTLRFVESDRNKMWASRKPIRL